MHGLVSGGYVFEVEGMQHVAYGGGTTIIFPNVIGSLKASSLR